MSDWLRDRMLGYYPEVVKQLYEIQAIIDGEYPEFRLLTDEQIAAVQNNAYLVTMNETRIQQWEELLNLQVIPGSTIENRRDAVIARIRGNGKLNTKSIQNIVNTFTGGSANAWIEDSVLYVEITPPDKTFIFKNVERELQKRIPAHLGMNVYRKYSSWNNIKLEFTSWNALKSHYETWDDVHLHIRQSDVTWNDLKNGKQSISRIRNQFFDWRTLYHTFDGR